VAVREALFCRDAIGGIFRQSYRSAHWMASVSGHRHVAKSL